MFTILVVFGGVILILGLLACCIAELRPVRSKGSPTISNNLNSGQFVVQNIEQRHPLPWMPNMSQEYFMNNLGKANTTKTVNERCGSSSREFSATSESSEGACHPNTQEADKLAKILNKD